MLASTQWGGLDGSATDFNEGNLDDDCDEFNEDEHGVVAEIFKDIDLVSLELSGIDFIEDLHEDESVEDNSVMYGVFGGPMLVLNTRGDIQDLGAEEKKNDQHNNLIDGLTKDISPHDTIDEVLVSAIGLSLEEFIFGGFSGKGQRSKGIHDKIDPEHLDGSEG